ncbi:hypothetical protein THRCLA_21990 [Thraustotheca clavata]|uniref:Uncharacterized protein n=1 Tax=Thraustotheca clavata TaxID=74557 RepID=A0A1V9ZFA7_9STRA|nr:hypothetical protein THRCLA_21990 [Thraustotheca clavata]
MIDSTIIIILSVVGSVILLIIGFLLYRRRKRLRDEPPSETYFKTTTTANTSDQGFSYPHRPYTMDAYPIHLSSSDYLHQTASPHLEVVEKTPDPDMYYGTKSPATLPITYSRKLMVRNGRPASFAGSGVSEDSSIVSQSERESETEWTTKLRQQQHRTTSSSSSSSASSSPRGSREIIILHDATSSLSRDSDPRFGDSMYSQPSLGHTFVRGSSAFRVSSFSYDFSPSILDSNGSTVIMEAASQTSRESYDI